MLNLFWNPFSISYLVEFILVSMMAGYFATHLWADFRSDKGMRTNAALFVTFSALSVNLLLQFLKVSLHPHFNQFVLPWIGPAGAVALCGYLYFACQFASNPDKPFRWSNVLIAVAIIIVGLELDVAFQRHLQLAQGLVEFRDSWMDLPLVLGFLAALLAFFGHMVRAIAAAQSQSISRSILPAIWTLFSFSKPHSRAVAAARAFLLISILPLVLEVFLLLRSFGIIGPFLAEIVANWAFVLLIAGFTLVFLNYVPDRSSFRIKLIGITLTTVLTIIGSVAWFVGPIGIGSYQNNYLVNEQSAMRFELNADAQYVVSPIDYQFDEQIGDRVDHSWDAIKLPFAFPFYGTEYDKVFARRSGLVGFDYMPHWQHVVHRFGPQPGLFPLAVSLRDTQSKQGDATSGLFVKREKNWVVITWNNLVSVFDPDIQYTFQVVLYSNGSIDFVYADLPDNVAHDYFQSHAVPMMVGITPGNTKGAPTNVGFASGLPASALNDTGLMEFYLPDFLGYLNTIYAPIGYFTLAASLLVLTVFPIFFRVNLDRPLARLLDGVQQFRAGDLSTNVAVTHNDEIGFLTQSFNDMAHDQNDLVQTLEEKLAQRTKEASKIAAENARLAERNHLSRELHDTVNQTLFSATLIADTLPELLERQPKLVKQSVEEIRQLNRSALAEMRLLLLELRPSEIVDNPLGSLLEKLAEKIENEHSLHLTVQIESDLILPEEIQFTFYRVAQECLSNICKHAQASQVDISFDSVTTQALLVISDNGRGFAPDDVPTGHLGLQIMKERMEMIGGSLEIKSAPGKGTSLTAIWFENDTD